MERRFLFLMVYCSFVVSTYDIYRSSCRKHAVFQLQYQNQKLTGNILAAFYAELLAHCARKCTQEPTCKTINYKKPSSSVEQNCEILGNEKLSNTFEEASDWNFYEPLIFEMIPSCMVAENGAPCNAGYRCEESCLPGGPRYTCVDINECLSNPCQNGGTCANEINRYSCHCVPGYAGVHCETDINECSSDPCQNGGTCVDRINKYSCNCVPGYTGVNCQTDINECSSNPCQNGGTCNDRINKYSCTCVPGYTDMNCQTDINECASNPCVHGSCYNHLNSFSCSCNGGWTGTRCDIDINECQSGPCKNGATCHNKVNSYSCSCTFGWGGYNCDKFLGIG